MLREYVCIVYSVQCICAVYVYKLVYMPLGYERRVRLYTYKLVFNRCVYIGILYH